MGRPEIRDYLARHSRRYTPEALRAQLVAAGYSPDDVAEAERELSGGETGGRPTLRTLVVLYVVGLFALTLLTFWLFVEFPGGIGILGPAILGLVLVIVGLIEIRELRRSRAVQMGLTTGVVAALVVPAVTVLALGGLCVSTTGGQFALPHQRTTLAVLSARDGWDAAAGQRLSERGTIGLIQGEDGNVLPLPGGARLIVEFASTLPADAVVHWAEVVIIFRPQEPVADPGADPEAPLLKVSVGSGDLRDPVVSLSEVAGFGGGEGNSYASIVLGDLTSAQEIADLKAIIEEVDPKAAFDIDAVVLNVEYHRR